MKNLFTIILLFSLTKVSECFCQSDVDIVLSQEFCAQIEELSQEGYSFELRNEIKKYEYLQKDSIRNIEQVNQTMRYAILLAINHQTAKAYSLGNSALDYYSTFVNDSTDLRFIGIMDAFSLLLNAYGLYSQALYFQKESINLRERYQVFGDGYAYALENLYHSYSKLRNYHEAMGYILKLKLFLEEKNRSNSFQYASCLRNIAENYLYTGDYDNFLLYENLAHSLYKKLRAKCDEYTHKSILISALLFKQRYNDAYLLSKKNEIIAKKTFGSSSIQVIKALQMELSALVKVNDSITNTIRNDGKSSFVDTDNENIIISRLDSIANNFDQISEERLLILENLMDYRISKRDIEGIDLWGDNKMANLLNVNKECQKICENIFGTHNDIYARLQMLRAYIFETAGLLDEAARESAVACKTIKRISRENLQESLLYAYYLMHGAHYMMEAHKYDNALEMALFAKSIYQKNRFDNTLDYASLLLGLSDIYECKKLRNQAIFYNEEAIRHFNTTENVPTYLLISSLISLADKYGFLNPVRYCQLISEVIQLSAKSHVPVELSTKILGCIVNMLIMSNKYDEALSTNEQLLEISKNIMSNSWTGSTNAFLYTYLLNLYTKSEILSIKKKYEEGLNVINEGIELIEKNPEKASLINNIAYNYYSRKYALCNVLGKESEKEICRKKIANFIEWDSSPSMTKNVVLTELLYQIGDCEKLTQQIIDTSVHLDSIVVSLFSGLTSSEREETWREYSAWFTNVLPKFSFLLNEKSICEATYDGALFFKGLLMNVDSRINQEIENSADPVVHRQQEQLKAKKEELSKIVEAGNIGNYQEYKSLSDQIRDLERSISLAVSTRFVNSYYSTKWKDIQKYLPKDGIAIEHLMFQLNKDSIMYVALLLDKKHETPFMVPLFESIQLEKLSEKDIYETRNGYDLVWKPLERHLNGIKEVYFSPIGILNNIAIESLPIKGNKCFGEKYKTYRLSSTRQLIPDVTPHIQPNRTTLFGGLQYSADSCNILNHQNIIDAPITTHDTDIKREYLREASVYLQDLPFTLIEVEKIADMLHKKGIFVTKYIGVSGTENAFKSSTKDNSIIHVATHGFVQDYWNDSFASKVGISQGAGYIEDFILDNTGLFMSGVNHYINKGKLPDGTDDGILTSREIASLDLSNTDMVVLSACQSGIGSITSDGVFGLQRGFKKSGVNSIVVTLKSVYDEPSEQLMVRFYENIINKHQSKREALINAQKYIRDELGYKKYEYWVPFILIDGLN